MSHRYRLIEVLGQGGFGVVYRALQIGLGREVACKVARAELLESETGLARFRREMEACAALSHPNIVKIFDFGRLDDGRLFFAMELLDATDLGTVIRERGPLPIADAASYLTQAADALVHLHGRKMLHRDIKPANLMVDRQGRLVMMDFSIVRIDGRTKLTRTGEIAGTLLYLPPEVLDGQTADRPSFDVFSLGATFWEALAGYRFIRGKSPIEVLDDLRTRSFPPLRSVRPEVPPWLSDLLEKTLARDPDERPSSTDILETCRRHTARAPRAHAPRVASRPTPAPLPDVLAAGRARRWGLTAAVALSALLACLAGWWLLPDHLSIGAPRPSTRPGATGLGLHRVSFPGFRRLTVDLETPIEQGSVLELRAGERTVTYGKLDESRRTVTFDRLPADTTCRLVEVLPGGGLAAGSAEVRLPRVVPVEDFLLVPSETSALVDFGLPESSPVTVAIHRAGEPEPEPGSPVRETGRVFHRLFTGLRPSTGYEVRISGEGVWMGLAEHPFATRDERHGRRRKAWLSQLDGPRSGMSEILLVTRPELDPELAAPARSFFLRERSHGMDSFLIWLTEHLRDLQLAEILASDGYSHTDDPITRATALVRARHPKAGPLVQRLLESASSRTDLCRTASILDLCGGPETCDRLGKRRDQTREYWLAPEWMIRHDRSRAREYFERWARVDPLEPSSRMREGILGLALLGDERALGEVARAFASDCPAATKILAAQYLSGVGGPRARALLSDLVRRTPDPTGYLWPLARCAIADDAPIFEGLLARSTDRRVRRNAALVLGYLRATACAPTLRGALGDPDPAVVQAAAWATGQIRDRTAAPALEQLVAAGRDAGGVAAHALGETGHSASVQVLRASLLSRLERKRLDDLAALGPTVHALMLLTDGRARDEIETAVSLAKIPGFVQELVHTLLIKLGERSPAITAVIFPQAPLVRTGLACQQGDWVEIASSGFWAYEGEGQHLASVTAKGPDAWKDRPPLRLCGIVGRQKWRVEETPHRAIVEADGELELTAFAGAVLDEVTGYWAATHGMGFVTIRSSAARPASWGPRPASGDRAPGTHVSGSEPSPGRATAQPARASARPASGTSTAGLLLLGLLGLAGVLVAAAIARARTARTEAGGPTPAPISLDRVEASAVAKPATASVTDRLAQRYDDLAPVSAGLTGQVFRGRDRRLGRLVAIKVPDPQSVATPEDRERFLRGARSLASLSHAHLVQVYDVSTAGLPFYTMEWVDGESLADLVRKRGKLPLADALALMAPVAQVLALCHIRGIVHRDLKPEKILVDARGISRLTGFGRAFVDAQARLTRAGSLPVCSRHAPPEQREGGHPSPAMDVHAFGSILSEIISEPGELAPLVSACTARDPAGRPADGTALVERLTGLSQRVRDREADLAEFLDRLDQIVAADLHSLKNRLRLVDGASCAGDLHLVRERLAAVVPPPWLDPSLARRLKSVGDLLAAPDAQAVAQAHRQAIEILETFQLPFREALDQVARRYVGKGTVSVATDLPPPPVRTCDVSSARSDLELILTNLVDNALAAGASRVEITLGTAEPREDAATVQVADDGPGFANEDRQKALLAAFPERGPGRGTGLLTIAQVARHRGWRLELTGSPRTTFVLTVPVRSGRGS